MVERFLVRLGYKRKQRVPGAVELFMTGWSIRTAAARLFPGLTGQAAEYARRVVERDIRRYIADLSAETLACEREIDRLRISLRELDNEDHAAHSPIIEL